MFYTNIVHNLLFYEREGDSSLNLSLKKGKEYKAKAATTCK